MKTITILLGQDEKIVIPNSENIRDIQFELAGGAEKMDVITLKNGQVICIGYGSIGVYESWEQFEGSSDIEEPYSGLIPLKK